MRRPSEVNGFVRAYMKGGERAFQFSPDEYQPLLDAWMSGKTFFTGTDCYGDPQTVKLAEVNGIALATPESVAAYDEEDAAQRFEADD